MTSSYSKILPVFFAFAIGTVVYISWVELSDSLSRTSIRLRSFQNWVDQTNVLTPEPDDLTPMAILSRKAFKKLPEWSFEEMYRHNKEPRRTTCENSLLKTIKNHPNISNAFIPNIRLYVHNNSLSMRDWNRLSHFNNPFGFMEYKYEDVMSAINLVPKPTEPLLVPKPGSNGCIRCAVVGTGGVLTGSKKGEEIDAHDYVFRVNGAATKGFEEDVGNRTSVYVHTAHSITTSEWLLKKHNYTRAPHDEGIKYVMIPEGMRDFEWIKGLYKREIIKSGSYKNKSPWLSYSGQFNKSRFYVLHQDFLRYVRNMFLKSSTLSAGYWAIVRPTNGAFSLFLALHTCDTVSAYGFMTENYKNYSNYYYDRGVKTHVIFYSNHNYIMEMKLWKKLHDLNIIKLYQGNTTETETPGTPKTPKTPKAPKTPKTLKTSKTPKAL